MTAGELHIALARLEERFRALEEDVREVRDLVRETLAQARATNGRVNQHDVELARIKEREQRDTQHADNSDRRNQFVHRWLALAVAMFSLLASVALSVARI